MTTSAPDIKRTATLFGFSATLLGIGLGRFAYAPLVPALIESGWLTQAAAASSGAINFVGYVFGALLALISPHWLAPRLMTSIVVLTALSFPACAMHPWFTPLLGNLWFDAWRFVAGVGGAWLMVRGVSASLAALPAQSRAGGAGWIFSGIGIGTIISAAIGSVAVSGGPLLAWLLLTLAAAPCAGVAVRCWWAVRRAADAAKADEAAEKPAKRRSQASSLGALSCACLLLAAYFLESIGFVPHAIFWVDYLVRERGMSEAAGAAQWWLFGLGSVAGPIVAGQLAARFGASRSLLASYALLALAIGAPVLGSGWVLVTLSSIVVGMLVPATVTLTSTGLANLVGPARHTRWWAGATLGFAAGSAGGGALMAQWVATHGSYASLLVLSCGILIISTGLALAALLISQRQHL